MTASGARGEKVTRDVGSPTSARFLAFFPVASAVDGVTIVAATLDESGAQLPSVRLLPGGSVTSIGFESGSETDTNSTVSATTRTIHRPSGDASQNSLTGISMDSSLTPSLLRRCIRLRSPRFAANTPSPDHASSVHRPGSEMVVASPSRPVTATSDRPLQVSPAHPRSLLGCRKAIRLPDTCHSGLKPGPSSRVSSVTGLKSTSCGNSMKSSLVDSPTAATYASQSEPGAARRSSAGASIRVSSSPLTISWRCKLSPLTKSNSAGPPAKCAVEFDSASLSSSPPSAPTPGSSFTEPPVAK